MSSVRFYPINVKTAEPTVPIFCVRWGPKYMDTQNFKNVCPKDFDFCNILKMRRELFYYCFIFYEEKMLTDRAII